MEESELIAQKAEEEERKKREQLDLEYAQMIERELNFRQSSSLAPDLERNPGQYQFDEDIGEEGRPAVIPRPNRRSNSRDSLGANNNQNERRYVKQAPPKWLTHPIKLDRNKQIKVYDFTEGSVNNELRKTNDTSVDYEWESSDHPALRNQSIEDLERKLAKKQQKVLRRFEKEEEYRVEEAKRNGSIIEDNKLEEDLENLRIGQNRMFEPLLPNQNNRGDAGNQNMNLNIAAGNPNGALLRERRAFL